jgi:hypothetical protein
MIDKPQTTSGITLFLPFASSAFGAFFGAVSAFWLGRVKQKRDELNRRHTALLATQYALLSQWTILETMRVRHLEPRRKEPLRHLKLDNYVVEKTHLCVPFSELTFIINSDEPNLLQDIHLAEAGYVAAMGMFDIHNKRGEELKENAETRDFDMATGRATMVAKNPGEVFMLKSITDLLYEQIDKAIPQLDAEVKKIHKFVKRNLKGMKAVEAKPIVAVQNPNQ